VFSHLRLVAAVLVLAGCRSPSGAPPLATTDDRFSYALGAQLGTDVKRSSHTVDPELVQQGFEDGLAGSSALSQEEIAAALKDGLEKKLATQDAQQTQRALAAEREGLEFLERNRARPGVVELPSGLQYEVLREGKGRVATTEDFVTCHYRGTLVDGTVFDDTTERGTPRSFQVTGVIDGFEEGLLRMPAGSRWKLYVPSELAYGAYGAGHKIPPNSALIFDVELLEVGPRPAGQPAR
jgi:FKBP-type peptidyl-prolyl cis-trans isomerase